MTTQNNPKIDNSTLAVGDKVVVVKTLEQSLRRKQIDVAVSTDLHDYAGLAKDVLNLLTSYERQLPVKHEYLAVHGKDKQWTIKASNCQN